MTDIERAKVFLRTHHFVLCRGGALLASDDSGISPMLDLIQMETDLRGSAVADKIVGRAVAMLFSKAGICEVYGEVMSRGAQQFLASRGIPHTYGTLVDAIRNRAGDGICPMEETVAGCISEEMAYPALWEKRERLRGGHDETSAFIRIGVCPGCPVGCIVEVSLVAGQAVGIAGNGCPRGVFEAQTWAKM